MQMQMLEGLEYSEVEVLQQIIFIACYKSLLNNNGHVKKLITIEVVMPLSLLILVFVSLT